MVFNLDNVVPLEVVIAEVQILLRVTAGFVLLQAALGLLLLLCVRFSVLRSCFDFLCAFSKVVDMWEVKDLGSLVLSQVLAEQLQALCWRDRV